MSKKFLGTAALALTLVGLSSVNASAMVPRFATGAAGAANAARAAAARSPGAAAAVRTSVIASSSRTGVNGITHVSINTTSTTPGSALLNMRNGLRSGQDVILTSNSTPGTVYLNRGSNVVSGPYIPGNITRISR